MTLLSWEYQKAAQTLDIIYRSESDLIVRPRSEMTAEMHHAQAVQLRAHIYAKLLFDALRDAQTTVSQFLPH